MLIRLGKKRRWLLGIGVLCIMAFAVKFIQMKGMKANSQSTTVVTYQGKIAITFDDGPSQAMTPQLLDGLKQRNVKATFFLIGEYVEQNPDIVKRMYEEGHLIGNHTYHHVQLNKVGSEQMIKEIESTNQAIMEITGECPQFLRPPFGAWSKKMEQDVDMIPVLWNVDPLDWCKSDAGKIAENVVTHVKESDIILLHDRYASSVTAAFAIIDTLKERGYEFVTVDELITE